MSAGSTFQINQSFADSNGSSVRGSQTVNPPTTGNNTEQISQQVNHNALVSATAEPGATTYDVVIFAGTLAAANVYAMGFQVATAALNGNSLTPQVYIKLKTAGNGGGTGDIVIPLVPGQAWTWTPAGTTDANGNAITLGANNVLGAGVALLHAITTITVTPDKYSDVIVTGTIEVST